MALRIPNRLGTVVVGRILEDQDTYNELEDCNGVLHRLHKGDVVAGLPARGVHCVGIPVSYRNPFAWESGCICLIWVVDWFCHVFQP